MARASRTNFLNGLKYYNLFTQNIKHPWWNEEYEEQST